ncbi:MAG: hypothetical protein ACRD4E_16975 [Bryobacteraceae bacterium]
MLFRVTISIAALAMCGFADTLILRSGASVQGNYAGGDTRHVKMVVGDHVESYPLDEVARLEFGSDHPRASNSADRQYDAPPATPPPVSTPPPSTPPPPPDSGLRSERPYEQSNAANTGIEIPGGTVLVVRMIDNVDSERDSMGKTFRASIDEPVVVNGYTVIPRGADVVAKLVDEQQSGKFEGRASLTLDLMQIQINGRMVDVSTSEVSQASGSRGARTAKTVGGGAALGAILGGIFGGGKGAAIVAASGGTLGAGAQVATHGQRVKIPSETRLSFTLQNSIRG